MFITKDVFRHLFKNIIDINEDSIRLLINMYNSCSWMKECMTYDQLSFVEEWKIKAQSYIKRYFIDLESDRGECTKCGKKFKYSKLSKHQRNCKIKILNDYKKNDIAMDYCETCKWRHPVVTYHYKYKDKETLQCNFIRKTKCKYCNCEIFWLVIDRHQNQCDKRCECVLRKRLSPFEIKCNKLKGVKESHYFEQCKVKKIDNTKFCRFHNSVRVIYS